MVVLPRGTINTPGPCWWESHGWVLVRCKNGHAVTLLYPGRRERNHSVAADGTVSPSLVCPEEGCDWHEVVRLDGWNETEPPEAA